VVGLRSVFVEIGVHFAVLCVDGVAAWRGRKGGFGRRSRDSLVREDMDFASLGEAARGLAPTSGSAAARATTRSRLDIP